MIVLPDLSDTKSRSPFKAGSGFRVPGSGFRVPGSGFRVPGSGFRVFEEEKLLSQKFIVIVNGTN